jgi:hypothetical protein
LGIRRFFVSPIEAGELCLMASIMGESGDIIFPELDEERDMIPFDRIAKDLLVALGLDIDVCASENEALKKMAILRPHSGRNGEGKKEEGPHSGRNGEGKKEEGPHSGRNGEGEICEQPSPFTLQSSPFLKWPVFFFKSDTSGEKSFEEFYTPGEDLDLDKFISLGVVKNSKKRSMVEIDEIFIKMHKLFDSGHITKAEVVDVLKDYLPNFAHIETGKGLDQKM